MLILRNKWNNIKFNIRKNKTFLVPKKQKLRNIFIKC